MFIRAHRIALVACSLSALVACGGGGGTSLPHVTLTATLTSQGTYVECSSPASITVSLERVRDQQTTSETVTCPVARVLAGDFALSQWRAVIGSAATGDRTVMASTATTLPKPVVLQDDTRWVVVPTVPSAVSSTLPLSLQAVSAAGVVVGTYDNPTVLTSSQMPSTPVAQWKWIVTSGGVDYASASAKTLSYTETDLGFWGALAIGDTDGDGRPEILGTSATATGIQVLGLDGTGLSALGEDREFRDVRLVDLNNDGLVDVVSNVYGTGCALVGLRQAGGGYAFATPLRKDGSCIGGHGETLVVADFDGDGLVDVLLPSYERFDYLRNLGNGNFEEIADDLGISFPNYVPHVEGAAAVDVNLDGNIDLVVASEVLLNDGKGHFTPLTNPFGPTRVHDEGMSVADVDGDGVFDIVKNDPTYGPRIFWGQSDRQSFADAGWLLGGGKVLSGSYGIAVADFKGNGLADLVLAGGAPSGQPPVFCAHTASRQFDCLFNLFPAHDGAWQDLLLATDLNGDGATELVSRFGNIRTFISSSSRAHVFSIDVRDAAGRANQFGRTVRATCAADGSLVGLAFVDGGNGYMAQGGYEVTFSSDWCAEIRVEVPTLGGVQSFGPYKRGAQKILLAGA